jgi:hypothetical protein
MAQLKELAQSGIHFCVGLDLEPYGGWVRVALLDRALLFLLGYAGPQIAGRCLQVWASWSSVCAAPPCLVCTALACLPWLPLPTCRLVCERAVHTHWRPGP